MGSVLPDSVPTKALPFSVKVLSSDTLKNITVEFDSKLGLLMYDIYIYKVVKVRREKNIRAWRPPANSTTSLAWREMLTQMEAKPENRYSVFTSHCFSMLVVTQFHPAVPLYYRRVLSEHKVNAWALSPFLYLIYILN